MKRSICNAVLAAVAALATCGVAGATVLDFETAGQYSGNFRAWAGSGLAHVTTQSSLGAANDYVIVDRVPGATASALVALYDSTPGNTADAWNTFDGTITVSWDVMANFANTSFAVFFINPTTTGSDQNVMSIVNVTASGTNETIRHFIGNPLNGTAAGTQVGTTQTQNTATQGIFGTMTVVYTPATGVLRTMMGPVDYSTTLTTAQRDAIGTNPGVAFRINDTDTGTTAAYFDNVSIVPEPTMLGLLALSGLTLARRRRA